MPNTIRRIYIPHRVLSRGPMSSISSASRCASNFAPSGAEEIERGADDGLGVDPVVLVERLRRSRLAEVGDPERRTPDTPSGAEEGERRGMAVQDADQRKRPGKEPIEDRS